jgi:peroxiredoxin
VKPYLVYPCVVVAALTSGVAGYYLQRSGLLIRNAVAPLPAIALEERSGAAQVRGMQRPDFSLADINGKMRRIDEWNGRVIALNFWATWCPPCRQEIPEFVALQSRYADRGLQIVGIALQRPEEVQEFMQEHHINYPVLAGELDVIALSRVYGNDIGALPYTVIIDRQGKIVFVKQGRLSGEVAERVIARLL